MSYVRCLLSLGRQEIVENIDVDILSQVVNLQLLLTLLMY